MVVLIRKQNCMCRHYCGPDTETIVQWGHYVGPDTETTVGRHYGGFDTETILQVATLHVLWFWHRNNNSVGTLRWS